MADLCETCGDPVADHGAALQCRRAPPPCPYCKGDGPGRIHSSLAAATFGNGSCHEDCERLVVAELRKVTLDPLRWPWVLKRFAQTGRFE